MRSENSIYISQNPPPPNIALSLQCVHALSCPLQLIAETLQSYHSVATDWGLQFSQMAEVQLEISLSDDGSHLSIVDQNLDAVPDDLGEHYGAKVTDLALAFNNIKYAASIFILSSHFSRIS
jgi:hypothetical protein